MVGWAAWLVGCGPTANFRGEGVRAFEFDVADPRCVPTERFFAPALRLVSDAGLADAGYLAWDRVEVRLEGLPPCRLVDMVFGQAFGGFAYSVFQADYEGVVSTARAPLRGSWSGADLDGPVYSAEGLALVQDINIIADWGTETLLEATWLRRPSSQGVDVLPIRGARGVYGDLYLPSPVFGRRRPAILVIGGSEGGSALTNEVARTFVEQGYYVLALSYWGIETLPQNIDRIRLEYFLEALELLKEYPGIDGARLGVIGVSRGGEAALLLGAATSSVKAVVSVVGSGLSWPAWEVWTEPSWTLNDAGVSYVPWANATPRTLLLPDGGVEVTFREVWLEAIRQASPAQLEAATIPVERIGGPVLLLGAEDDELWPSCALADIAWARLADAGHTVRFPADAMRCFPGAGHAISPGLVGLPMANSLRFRRPDAGVFERFGGTPQKNGQAARQGWEQVSAFLAGAL